MQIGKPLLFLLMCCCELLNSCAENDGSKSKADAETESFNAYLKSNFEDSIPTDQHIYIVVSGRDSLKSIPQILSRISEEIHNKRPGDYTTILSSRIQIPDSRIFLGKNHVDWDNAMDLLELKFSGVTLIQTEENKITSLLHLGMNGTSTEKRLLNW